METYSELRKRQQEEINTIPMGAAFSEEQFEEMRKGWGISKKDIVEKIVSLGCGMFIKKADLPEFLKMTSRHSKELRDAVDADKTGEGFIFQMFYEEMANHEYGYTGDPDDTLDTLGITMEQILNSDTLSRGFLLASEKFFE